MSFFDLIWFDFSFLCLLVREEYVYLGVVGGKGSELEFGLLDLVHAVILEQLVPLVG